MSRRHNILPTKINSSHLKCRKLLNCSSQTGIQVSKFPFVLDKLKKNRFKVFVNYRKKNAM